MQYSGANWVKESLDVENMSPLGEKVADLLGSLFQGIYHLGSKTLRKVEWDNPHYICVVLGWKSLSTYDYLYLTHLVFLAHWMCVRVEISPRAFHHLELMFHPRTRDGDYSHRHATLDAAVSLFKTIMAEEGIEEVK